MATPTHSDPPAAASAPSLVPAWCLGTGKVIINGRAFEDYFPTDAQRMIVSEPLRVGEANDAYDVYASKFMAAVSPGRLVHSRMAIARSIVELDGEKRAELKSAGLLRHDPRKKESKKYGLRKARKAKQFTKR